MKIIIFNEGEKAGGMDTFIVNLIRYWPEKTDEFLLICNHNHPSIGLFENQSFNNLSIKTHKIPLNWSFLSSLNNILPHLLQRALRQIFRLLLTPVQYTLIKSMLKKEKADVLLSVNGAYPGGETCRLANIAWKRIDNGCSIHNFHNLAIPERPYLLSYDKLIDRLHISATDCFVSVSKYCSHSIKVRTKFKKVKNIKTVPNGIRLADRNSCDLPVRDECRLKSEIPIIVMIARFEAAKGHKFMFEVMQKVVKKVTTVRLVLIGTGTESEIRQINNDIVELGLEANVIQLGNIKNASTRIRGADILVVPSRDFESFGLTALEAMLNKIPVIVSGIGGLPETIGEYEECGYIIPKNNSDLFSEKILYLIDNKDVSTKMGQAGYKRAIEFYDPRLMAQNYRELITEELENLDTN
tara:strand:- start:1509 stop:2744 length:1236 start_codon:yes stop_codon:yes gene_type:complete